jgi:hypothetical protein
MFCTVSGFRNALYTPHVFRASIGEEWMSIQGNLPPHPINHVEALNDSIWVVASDAGVHWTENRGVHWEPVGSLPLIPVYDLAIDTIFDRLVAGTFARSMWSFPLDSLLPPPPEVQENSVSAFTHREFRAFPNPFGNALQVTAENAVNKVTILTVRGQVISEFRPKKRQTLVTSDWNPGTYIIRWTYDNGQDETQILLKQ